MSTELLPAIPRAGAKVSSRMVVNIEQTIAANIVEIEDIDTLEEYRAKAAALTTYLRDKELQRPMLGAQRRIEARIGQLLGEAKPGPKQSSVVTEVSDKHDRSDFRILAKGMACDPPLTDEEWRKSRRSLISLLRNRLGVMDADPDIDMTVSDAEVIQGDCLDVMHDMEPASVDLVFGSPPYEDARDYSELGFDLAGDHWVDWMLDRCYEAARISRGLVAFVVEGKVRKYQWSATPILLMQRLHNSGLSLRKPVIYKRHGTPGSGGPDWLRNDYEFVICFQEKAGKLPWSNNTACGTPPKWGNEGGHKTRLKDGSFNENGYEAPEVANPGNVVECLAGGGHMGSPLASKNEAPFPETLAEFFVKSFCPPGGTVLDPFSGSGTTLAAARANGRKSIGIDVRESQVSLTRRRVANTQAGFIK